MESIEHLLYFACCCCFPYFPNIFFQKVNKWLIKKWGRNRKTCQPPPQPARPLPTVTFQVWLAARPLTRDYVGVFFKKLSCTLTDRVQDDLGHTGGRAKAEPSQVLLKQIYFSSHKRGSLACQTVPRINIRAGYESICWPSCRGKTFLKRFTGWIFLNLYIYLLLNQEAPPPYHWSLLLRGALLSLSLSAPPHHGSSLLQFLFFSFLF